MAVWLRHWALGLAVHYGERLLACLRTCCTPLRHPPLHHHRPRHAPAPPTHPKNITHIPRPTPTLQEVKATLKDIMGRLMQPDQMAAAMEELYWLRRCVGQYRA